MIATLKRIFGVQPTLYHRAYVLQQWVWVKPSNLADVVVGEIIGISNGLYTVATDYHGWVYVDVNDLNAYNEGVLVESEAG